MASAVDGEDTKGAVVEGPGIEEVVVVAAGAILGPQMPLTLSRTLQIPLSTIRR